MIVSLTETSMTNLKRGTIAYFSMEFAVDAHIPNYAGGLGVLAADIMHSAADMKAPLVGVSILYHQHDNPVESFDASPYMTLRPERATITIEDREVILGAYEYQVKSVNGNFAPIFFLTTNFPENKRWDRDLTKNLYPSHTYTRLGQEVILGIGGVRMLEALGYHDIAFYHMNEGHAAFLTLEVLHEEGFQDQDVKERCSFTTHTPVAAGHDYFAYDIVNGVLRDMVPWHIKKLGTPDMLSMTHLAMNLSHKTNSVSEKHREVCREMFPGYDFENVTNGIHHLTWVSEEMAKVFDKHLSGWRQDPSLFAKAEEVLPDEELFSAHQKNKTQFVQWVNSHREFFPIAGELHSDDFFDEDTLTICFARRFVQYKRPELIFKNIERLRDVGYKKLQLVFAGRCHPDNHYCINVRENIEQFGRALRGQVRVAVVQDYDLEIASHLVSGGDVWLNNPIKPREASGTSGMKAALNGLLNLSILDGWWDEGYVQKPLSGWAFGERSNGVADPEVRDHLDCSEIHDRIEEITAEYYDNRQNWSKRMKAAISLLGTFNTHRVVDEYYEKMWKLDS